MRFQETKSKLNIQQLKIVQNLHPQCLQKRSAGFSRFPPHCEQNLAPVSVVATQDRSEVRIERLTSPNEINYCFY
jgi:hypothetical protein